MASGTSPKLAAPSLVLGAGVAGLSVGGLLTAALWRRRKMPRGKGVFVRSVRHANGPADMVRICRELGLSWVTIALAWQHADGGTRWYYPAEIPEHAKALADAGIRVRLWAWPEPGRAAELVSGYQWVAKRCRLEGFDLNPEQPYQGTPLDVANADLDVLQRLRVPLSCVSYGAPPSWHPRFPWKAWARCEIGMPELYDTRHRWGADHQQRSAAGWAELGFDEIAPVWGASDAHTPDQMRIEIEQTIAGFRAADVALRAGSWWDFYWLTKSKRRAALVSSYRFPDRFEGGSIA